MRNSSSTGTLRSSMPEHPRRLLDRRVRVLGAGDGVAAGDVARRDQRGERGRRGRVLDVPVPAVREPEQLPRPVGRAQLELGRGRRGAPEDRDLVQRRRDQLGEDPRLGGGDGEVGEEARVLPVRERRDDQLVEVAEDVRERLAASRAARRGASRDSSPGSTCASTGQLVDALEVAGRPVERRGAVLAEAHGFSRRRTSSHGRVLRTPSRVSHARRAWPRPSSV